MYSRYAVTMLLAVALLSFILFVRCDNYERQLLSNTEKPNSAPELTIRVNTFRRLDLIEYFMKYYDTCDAVKQIQVVWSDPANEAPTHWLKDLTPGKYIFEVHKEDSLSNRFRPLQLIPTDGVLSIDDDLIISCEDLARSASVWASNPRALVGFSPRMHVYDIFTGDFRYLKWQHTWWSGAYTIMLTKAAILHKDYLLEYDRLMPQSMIKHIDSKRNCEDIAMAFVVAEKSQAAPVWVQAAVYEVSIGGISSGASHFVDRSECLTVLKSHTNSWPWVTGYQKSIAVSALDWVSHYFSDGK